jgi:lysophospholipase L1-like esterase
MRCHTQRLRTALTTALLVACVLPANAAAESLWLPSGAGPMATLKRVDSGPSMRGSRPCMPEYTMIRAPKTPTAETDTSCAFYGDGGIQGNNLIEIGGDAGRPSVVGSRNHLLQPIPGAPSADAVDGGSWFAYDCDFSDPGCYLRFTSKDPVAQYDFAGRLLWRIEPTTGPALGLPGQKARVDTFSVAISDNGRFVVAVTRDRTGILWKDRVTGSVRKLANHPSDGLGFSVSAPVAVSNSGYAAVGGSQVTSGLTLYDPQNCPELTSPTTPTCSSVSIQRLLGLPEGLDVGNARSVKFYGDGVISFEARSASLPGGSSTETRVFNLQSQLAAGDQGEPTEQEPGPAPRSMFVMGDSFASGEGDAGHYLAGTDSYDPATGQPRNLCHQSLRAWPARLATEIGAQPSTTVACSGATSSNVINTAQWAGTGQSAPFPGATSQLTALAGSMPDELLVQIGGNDASFGDIVRACLAGGDCSSPEDQRKYALGVQNAYYVVNATLRRLRNERPNARITLVGYPAIVNPDGPCDGLKDRNVRLNASERRLADDLVRYIDQSQRTAASRAGVHYVSLLHTLTRDGHRLCDEEPWVNGVTAGKDAPLLFGPEVFGNETYHPTAQAHQAFADEIADELDELPTSSCGKNPCPEPGTAAAALPSWASGATANTRTRSWPNLIVNSLRIVTGTVTGLKPGTFILGAFRSTPRPIVPVVVDANGKADLAAAVPEDLEPGWHELRLQGTAVDGSGVDTVVPLIVPGPDGDRDGDGISDESDLCPSLPGTADDAHDLDRDGLGDPCDGDNSAEPQTITFDPPADVTYGDPPLRLSATASSGLSVSYAASGACSVDDGTLSVLGAGNCSITAAQPGNENVAPAAPVTRTFEIQKAAPHISLVGGTFPYDSGPHAADVRVTGINGEDLGPATIRYDGVHEPPVNAGTYEVEAAYVGSDNYRPATDATSIVIERAALHAHADDRERRYGDADPDFTGTLTGVQGADDVVLAFATDADRSSAVGEFRIRPQLSASESVLRNYIVTVENGTLGITRRPLRAVANDVSRPLREDNPPLNGTVTGIANDDPVEVVYSTPATRESGLGEYPIDVHVSAPDAVLANYDVTTTAGRLTVIDVNAPTLVVPGAINAEATGPDGAAIDFADDVTAEDDAGPPELACQPHSGTTFAIGDTAVECSASDGPHTTSGSFVVSVRDTTPPALRLPGSFAVDPESPRGATAEFTARATDVVDGPVRPECAPPSGSLFPLGPTVVACSAIDRRGNSSPVGSFVIDVRGFDDLRARLADEIAAPNLPPGVTGLLRTGVVSLFVQLERAKPERRCTVLNAALDAAARAEIAVDRLREHERTTDEQAESWRTAISAIKKTLASMKRVTPDCA